jgi:lipopolysaccharide transport system ATP-binding protein
MSNTVIQIEGLSKQYRLGSIGGKRLVDDANRVWAQLRGKEDPLSPIDPKPVTSHSTSSSQTLWALKDVSLNVEQGEVLGIIGKNGAGKSTLLKILSRVTGPTCGEVRVKGRIASLLEVGTGFHPDLTGRENIFLNGAILGMSKAEIRSKLDEIVMFSGVEKFIDTPVKRYSSGMTVRLAFAVAAQLEPEILIIDEVLAVGDIEFQKKCLGRMNEVSKEGRTVLFVSHNMSAVRALCRRGIVLERGCKLFDGNVSDAIEVYSAESSTKTGMGWARSQRASSTPVSFESISLSVLGEQPQLKLSCEILLRCQTACARSFLAVDIGDRNFSPIMQALPESLPFIEGIPGTHRVHVEVDLPPLIPGAYNVDLWLGPHYTSTFDLVRRELAFEVTASPSDRRSFPYSLDHGSIVPTCRYSYEM